MSHLTRISYKKFYDSIVKVYFLKTNVLIISITRLFNSCQKWILTNRKKITLTLNKPYNRYTLFFNS